MTVLVLGGGLRGAAACYLAKKAGHRVILCGKKQNSPALGLCDEFVLFDPKNLPAADCIFPAAAEEALLAPFRGEKLLFDPLAQAVCRSKLAGDDYLEAHGYPHPQRFPRGSEPYIVKPDADSYGRGIWATEDFCEVGGAVNANFLTQEELTGPVVSVTVWGRPGAYGSAPVLGLKTDDRYDLCEAFLPAPIPAEAAEAFAADARRLAEEIGLEGLLEVQAVFHGGKCKIIEMNGHLPELSALCLFAGAGINLVQELMAPGAAAGELRPCRCLCRKNGEAVGRRSAGDAGPMQAADTGFGNAAFDLFIEI